MTLASPAWLVLALPLVLLMVLFPPRSRSQAIVRIAGYLLVLGAMCGLGVRMDRPAGTVVVIADRSDSMPDGAEASQIEAYELLRGSMGNEHRLGLVSFGADAIVERPPGARPVERFELEIDRTASSLGGALRAASSLIPAGESGALLVISDGLATDTSALAEAATAGGRGLRIDVRALSRPPIGDISIARIDAPSSVSERDAFVINAYVNADRAAGVQYALTRGGQTIARGRADLAPGQTRLSFRDRADGVATLDYRLVIEPDTEDPIRENNAARHLIGVRGGRSVLVASRTPGGGLTRALQAQGIRAVSMEPGAIDWSLESLAGYAAVVLENVAIQEVGLDGAENIAALVEQQGLGLVMTGGRRSFAAGGWHESPIDPVLPVSMELRREFRKLAVSIVIAMDRSGSMGAPVGGGRTKMDLAGLAAAAVLGMLSPIDHFGAIAVDTEPHTIVSLTTVDNQDLIGSRLRSLRVGGGGIFVYEALRAAARQIADVERGTRHIILLADAADAEEPGAYRTLLSQLERTGVTVSVVGLGTPGDPDAPLLREIAERGGGRVFFTTDARLLPQIFTQDAVVVARGAFLDEPTSLRATGLLAAITGENTGELPGAGGYNPSFLRPDASLAVQTVDEYGAPFIAYWSVGNGRTAAFTGEANGEASGPLGAWPRTGAMLASLVRWASGQRSDLPRSMVASQRVEGGVVRVDLDVGAEGRPLLDEPRVLVVRRRPGREPERETIGLRFSELDRLTAELPLSADEVVAAALQINEETIVPLAPATLPYSPEHRPPEPRTGTRLLRDIARRSGGTERSDLAGMWRDLPVVHRSVPLAPWLYVLAIVALLLEVAERRLSLVSLASGAATSETAHRAAGRSKTGLMRIFQRTTSGRRSGTTPRPGEPASAERAAASSDDPSSTNKNTKTQGDIKYEEETGVLGALRSMRKP
ncbi:MAG: VWA domain-containing protein [Planctomycetota bacterium]